MPRLERRTNCTYQTGAWSFAALAMMGTMGSFSSSGPAPTPRSRRCSQQQQQREHRLLLLSLPQLATQHDESGRASSPVLLQPRPNRQSTLPRRHNTAQAVAPDEPQTTQRRREAGGSTVGQAQLYMPCISRINTCTLSAGPRRMSYNPS